MYDKIVRGVIDVFRDHFSFFTRIPVGGRRDFGNIEETQYLFPLVGLLIGVMLYAVSLLLTLTSLTTGVSAALLVAFLYFLTGILHLDGISDFFDGVVKSGEKQEKIDAMQDPALGVGGALAVFFTLLILFVEFESLLSNELHFKPLLLGFSMMELSEAGLFVSLVAAEVSAKLSMNTCTMFSSPIGRSSAKSFMDSMNWRSYLVSLALSIAILGILGPYMVVVGLLSQLVPIYLIRASRKNFGGGSGDMVGASNELTRVFALLLLLYV